MTNYALDNIYIIPIIYGNSRLLFNINGHEYLVQHPQITIVFMIIYGLFVIIYVQRKTLRGKKSFRFR